MPNYGDEKQETSKAKWITGTHRLREEIEQIRGDYITPDLMRTAAFDVPHPVALFNQRLHLYASRLRPKRGAFPDLWDEPVTTVQIPKDGDSVEAGRRLSNGQYEGAHPVSLWERTSEPVALADLNEWQRGKTAALTAHYFDANGGKTSEQITKTLVLPAHAADALVDQLDACLESLGWLPDAAVKDYEAGDSEVLTH